MVLPFAVEVMRHLSNGDGALEVQRFITLWIHSRKQRSTFAVDTYFSNGRSVISVQRPLCRHFDISPGGHVPDHKSVLMWMDAFRGKGNVSKERKGPHRGSLEHLKMWNEFVCQVRPVCDKDPTTLLTYSPTKEF
ncbi:hypothetical protein TNCV_963251 [Trichonephila clavipes]|nr:hypothetical protein TNCV_963251 [Trichonephila clavipes]